MTIKPRRSLLFMPGNNPRALEKAKSLSADGIVIDLEDAVAPSAKAEARQQALAAVQAGGYGNRELAVRINGFGTPWFDEDLTAVAAANVAIVVLPKTEHAEQVLEVVRRLSATTQLWAMIETPLGVANVEAIACAHPRLTALIMGTSDLSKELRIPVRVDRLGLQYSLGRCVVAARMAGIDIIDGVHLDFRNAAAFQGVCEQGRDLGFDGKSLIHPDQIATANQVFAPSAQEIERASQILTAWQEAQTLGLGLAVLDGKLIENLHAAEAERVLALAKAIATAENQI